MAQPVPVSDVKVVFDGDILQVVRQDMKIGEKVKTFEWARRSPGVRLIVVSEGKMLIAREYRRELGAVDYRLPGGKVFDTLKEYSDFIKKGGDIVIESEKAVKREAAQEVGLKLNSVNHLYTSKNGATVEWDLLYFTCTDFEELGSSSNEVGEDIDVVWLGFDAVLELCKSGEFNEDRSLGVLMKYILNNWRIS